MPDQITRNLNEAKNCIDLAIQHLESSKELSVFFIHRALGHLNPCLTWLKPEEEECKKTLRSHSLGHEI